MYPHWTENDVLVDGIQIHYTRTGNGDKPPLLLLHGFSDDGMCWLPVARDLEAAYDLILPDARGHGRSARVRPGEDVNMPADIAGLIRLLGLKKPVIGGHSMGGSVTSQVAAAYPELVGALILEDPGWFVPAPREEKEPEPPRSNPWFDFLLSAAGQSTESIVEKCHADSPLWQEAELLPWALSKQRFDVHTMETIDLRRINYLEVVRAIQCPTLLITADPAKGALVTPEMAGEVMALNPKVREAHVPGVGHSIRRDDYPGFMSAVRAFLKETAS
jgi:pimeloyl-ACP methyl ester carboxylesterase